MFLCFSKGSKLKGSDYESFDTKTLDYLHLTGKVVPLGIFIHVVYSSLFAFDIVEVVPQLVQ